MRKISLLVVFTILVGLLTFSASVGATGDCSVVLGFANFTPIFNNPASENNPIYFVSENDSITGQKNMLFQSGWGVFGATSRFYAKEADTYDVWFRVKNGTKQSSSGPNINPAAEKRIFKVKVDNVHLQNSGGSTMVYGKSAADDPDSVFGWYWEKASVTLTQGWHTLEIDTKDISGQDLIQYVRADMAFITNQTYTTANLPANTTDFDNGIGVYADAAAPVISSLSFGSAADNGNGTVSRLLSWTASDNKEIASYEIINCGNVIYSPNGNETSKLITLPESENSTQDFTLKAYDLHGNSVTETAVWEGAFTPHEIILKRANFKDIEGTITDTFVGDAATGQFFGNETMYFEQVSSTSHATTSFYVPEDGDYTVWFRMKVGSQGWRVFRAKIDGDHIKAGGVDKTFGEAYVLSPWTWYWDSAVVNLGKSIHTLTIDPTSRAMARVDIALITNKTYAASELPNDAVNNRAAYTTSFKKFEDVVDPEITDFTVVNTSGTEYELSWTATDNNAVAFYELYGGAGVIDTFEPNENQTTVDISNYIGITSFTLRAYDNHAQFDEAIYALPSIYTEIAMSADNFTYTANFVKADDANSFVGGKHLNLATAAQTGENASADVYVDNAGSYDIWFRVKVGNYQPDGVTTILAANERTVKAKLNGSFILEGGNTKMFGAYVLTEPKATFAWYWDSASVSLNQGWNNVTIDPTGGNSNLRIDMMFITNKHYEIAELPNTPAAYISSIKSFEDLSKPVISTLTAKPKNLDTLTFNWAATDNYGIIEYEIYRDAVKKATVAGNLSEYILENITDISESNYILKARDKHGNLTEKIVSVEMSEYYIKSFAFNSTVSVNGSTSVTAVIENNTGGNIDVCLIAALYDAGGRMLYMSTDPRSNLNSSSSEITLTADFSGYSGNLSGTYAKAFLWNTTDAMKPATAKKVGVNVPAQ